MRKQYSKSDIKSFIEVFPPAEHVMTKKSNVFKEDNKLFVDNNLAFICIDGIWFPSLKLILQKPDLLPSVTVDKGAIKFVVNGADIMRPGITKVDDFKKEDFVVIVDETLSKPIAVGKAIFSSDELMEQKSGKVLLNIHFVGDEFWQQ